MTVDQHQHNTKTRPRSWQVISRWCAQRRRVKNAKTLKRDPPPELSTWADEDQYTLTRHHDHHRESTRTRRTRPAACKFRIHSQYTKAQKLHQASARALCHTCSSSCDVTLPAWTAVTADRQHSATSRRTPCPALPCPARRLCCTLDSLHAPAPNGSWSPCRTRWWSVASGLRMRAHAMRSRRSTRADSNCRVTSTSRSSTRSSRLRRMISRSLAWTSLRSTR
jgi:hypothetical protein